MIDVFTNPAALPFAVSLAIVFGLFIIEIIGLLLGGTVLGLEGGDPDLDMDADFDLSDGSDADVAGTNPIGDISDGSETSSGLMTWIGARDVPFLIWLVAFLTMFGLYGLVIQSVATKLIGTPLYTSLAIGIVVVPAIATTRVIANWVALIMPKTESSAMRVRFLGGHRGVITQGTATRGHPAEAKIKDRYDNIHYLRVEPLEDDGVFPQGSDVTLIRKRGDKFFVI